MRFSKLVRLVAASTCLILLVIFSHHVLSEQRSSGTFMQNFQQTETAGTQRPPPDDQRRSGTIMQYVQQAHQSGSPETQHPPDKAQKQRYIIYKCGRKDTCGGWADRFKGIVTAYVLSTITNRRFGIQMNMSCALNSVLHQAPNSPNWNTAISHTVLTKTQSSEHYFLGSVDFYNSVQTANFSSIFRKPVVYMRTNLDYIDNLKKNKLYTDKLKWMENLTRDQVYKHVYNKLFVLEPESQKILDDFLTRARPTTGSRLVCAHVRMGRNPTIPNDKAVRGTNSDVQKVWSFLKRFNDTNKYKIFFASDSENVTAEARNLFRNQLVENKGEIIHVDQRQDKVDENCGGFRKVIVDQQILMHCDVLMISFSGFSRMAAYIRGKDEDTFCLLRNHTGIIPCKPSTMKELYNVKG